MNTSALPADPPAPSIATLYRGIWHYAEGARLHFAGGMALLLASQLAKLAVPWLAAQAINRLQLGGPGVLAEAGRWVLLLMLTYLAVWGLHGPGRILERSVGVRVRQTLTDSLYDKLTRAPLAWHDLRHSGDLQHRVGQASRALGDFAQNQFVYLQSAVSFFGPMVALTLLSGIAGLVAIGGYLLIGLVILRFDRSLMRHAAAENQAERRYAAGLLDFVGNIATITSLRLQPSTRRLIARRLEAVFVPLKRIILLNEAKWCAVDLLSVGLTWLLLAAYVWQAHQPGATLLLGSVFMVYQYGQQAASVVASLASNFQALARTRTDYASADPIWAAPLRPAEAPPVPPDWREIRIEGLGFDHAQAKARVANLPPPPPGDGGGLHEVTLTLPRGRRIALVGPSGSGKSSLMRVLAGLYEPQAGRILVDGQAPDGLTHLGAIATLIPQEADVFEATVRENLAFDLPRTEAEIARAVHVAAFDTVLATLPGGLDTPLVERGYNLSGGQRQRLCLARGVLAAQGSSLLMLDEPTSALDPVTEAQVHERLATAFPDATIVASVHRMALLAHFDTVVLMAAGRVVDSGTPDELAERQPLFRGMLHRPSTTASTG